MPYTPLSDWSREILEHELLLNSVIVLLDSTLRNISPGLQTSQDQDQIFLPLCQCNFHITCFLSLVGILPMVHVIFQPSSFDSPRSRLSLSSQVSTR